jgi:hypothetical protein
MHVRLSVLVCVTIVAVAGVLLSGCTQQDPAMAPYVGSWSGTYSWGNTTLNETHHTPGSITFYGNGTYHAAVTLMSDVGTWSVSGVVLTKTIQGQSPVKFDAVFSDGNRHLVLTSQGDFEQQWNLTK